MLRFRTLFGRDFTYPKVLKIDCVAAMELCIFVRGFGHALFLFGQNQSQMPTGKKRGKEGVMKETIKISLFFCLMLLVSVLVFTACGECEHEWGEWSVSTPSTCSAQGTKQRKCSKCEEVQSESIDIADHKYDTENIVWTWNDYESATATLSCIMDSAHTRQINANVTDEVTTAPTCTATGTKTYTATVKICITVLIPLFHRHM